MPVAPDGDGVVERVEGKHGLVRRHFMDLVGNADGNSVTRSNASFMQKSLADTRGVAFTSARRNPTPGSTPLALSSIGYPANQMLKRSRSATSVSIFWTIKVQQ
jgi:hypothetical protein